VITLVRVIRTSIACPSQWDAWDPEGRYYYLRFRHGYGAVKSAESHEAYESAWEAAHWDEDAKQWRGLEAITLVAEFEDEDERRGDISLEEFCQRAGLTLASDIERTAFWRNISNQLNEEFKDDPAALARADQFLGGADLDEED
jgi:hypothetical protein